MKIVVNDIAAGKGGGVAILKQLQRYIVESKDTNEWIFLLSDSYVEESDNVKVLLYKEVQENRLRRLWFDFVSGKGIIADMKPDVVLYLQNTLVRGVNVPQIMYMDQSIPFQREKVFSFFKKAEFPYAIYQHLIGKLNFRACKKANKVIVQTEWLKKAIENRCHVSPNNVIKLYPDVSGEYRGCHAEKVKSNKFFYPASCAVYKNHKCITEAVKELGEDEFEIVLTVEEDMGPHCVSIGAISQEEVYQYMQETVLIFPSYIESYGLPLKEAREIGTLILVADTAFAREILEGYENAYYFNPFQPRQLADLMKKVLGGQIQHKVQKKEDDVDVKASSWKRVVEIMKEECNEKK